MSIKSIKPITLRKVVKYLRDDLGLSVYGNCRDLEKHTEGPGCRDYDPDDVIKYRKLLMNGVKFTEEEY